VDVESVTTRSSINNITERYFSDSENEIIRKFSQKSRDRIFYRIWAFKEAAIKAASLGSEISVDSVLVDLTHNNKLNLDKKSRILENFSNLKLLELELDDPFVGFIAIIG
jgi:phosphopantetheine--protein transferase-like protein